MSSFSISLSVWRLIAGLQTKVEPYSPLATGNYEMANMNDSTPGEIDSQQEFFREVNELREGIDQVKANITRIESLHQRSLTDIDESTSSQTQHQLDSLVADTSALNKALANRIRRLKGKAITDPSKAPQVNNLDRSFKDALRKYQSVEATFQKRAREQMARQYRIVRPDATEQEVEEACNDGQGQQIFSQAVSFNFKGARDWDCPSLTHSSFCLVTAGAKHALHSAKCRRDTMRSNVSRRLSLSWQTSLLRWSSWSSNKRQWLRTLTSGEKRLPQMSSKPKKRSE